MVLALFNKRKISRMSKTEAIKNTSSQWNNCREAFFGIAWVGFSILAILICLALVAAQTLQLDAVRRTVEGWYTGQSLAEDRVVSCYYNTPTPGSQSQLLPADIHPHLCTHINVAFAEIRDKQIYLEDHQFKSLAKVVALKKQNPKLKVLLSVGGASNDSGFPAMVADHASRKVFIRSIKSILRNYSLDGIDLDWEFPAVHNFGAGLRKRERQHFSQLLREIRMEYNREKRDYILTIAVAAQQIIADAAYDVDQINMYVDYVNIMTYDFHFYTKFTPFTGLNSPLYARSPEQLYTATLNINYTVHMYLDKGLDRNKIVVGIPTYGHTFELVNAENGNVGSPASGYGDLGQAGFVNFPDVCHFLKIFHADVIVHFDLEAEVPYFHRDLLWVSFENPLSVMSKAKYIAVNDLRGAMIYSLNADDYEGLCLKQCFKVSTTIKFPLATTVKKVLDEYNNRRNWICYSRNR